MRTVLNKVSASFFAASLVKLVIIISVIAIALTTFIILSPLYSSAGRGANESAQNVPHSGGQVVIKIIVRNWRYDPVILSGSDKAGIEVKEKSEYFADVRISVKRGEAVRIVLENVEPNVPHGFVIEGYTEPVVVPPGKSVEIGFVADKPGAFSFYCTVFCGTGHPLHRGTFVVG
jgi:heme/copper-type cytochrome/quinol oxidase subunit 2